jgi:hypothetical protein
VSTRRPPNVIVWYGFPVPPPSVQGLLNTNKMNEFRSLLERCRQENEAGPITDTQRATADKEARKVLDATEVAIERKAA